MPNRRNSRNRPKGGSPISFSYSASAIIDIGVPNGDTSQGIGLTPATLSAPLIALAKAFKYYRFKKLTFSLDPVVRFETTVPTTGSAGKWALAYVPEGVTASFTGVTPTQLLTCKDCVSGMAQVVNSNITDNSSLATGYPGYLLIAGDTTQRVLKVRRRTLNMGSQRYYFCQGTPGLTTIQGDVLFALQDSAGGNTVVLKGLVHFTIDFVEPEDSINIGAKVPRSFPSRLSCSRRLPSRVDDEKGDDDSSIVEVPVPADLSARALAQIMAIPSVRAELDRLKKMAPV